MQLNEFDRHVKTGFLHYVFVVVLKRFKSFFGGHYCQYSTRVLAV